MDLAIVDSGGANLGSVRTAFERLGCQPLVTRDAERLAAAGRVVLPGVGSFAACMDSVRQGGLEAVIGALRQPVLGICVGLQMLTESSTEGARQAPLAGLGIFDARVEKLPASRLPHMGWARTRANGHALFEGLADDYFYFVHSYAAAGDGADVIATAEHGATFAAALARNNFCAVQFHPERSAAAGARVLRNFLHWRP